MSPLVYAPSYDLYVPLLGAFHPFDGRKFSRAFARIEAEAPALANAVRSPDGPMSEDDLALVHTRDYLASLHSFATFAEVVELPSIWAQALAWLPLGVHSRILEAMRWACSGTLLSARIAIADGSALNIGGGFHHAKPGRGEGFCFFADVALAIAHLRRDGTLQQNDRILHVDLDAHQGNGVATCFLDDPSVLLYDQFNADLYPNDPPAATRIDCPVRVNSTTDEATYLGLLQVILPQWLDDVSSQQKPALAFYNAGTDILAGDPLGQLDVSAAGILQRDRFVLKELTRRAIPWVLVTSGGYTLTSAECIASTMLAINS